MKNISQGWEIYSFVALFLSQGIIFFNFDPKLIFLTWKSNPIFLFLPPHLHTTPAHHTYTPHLHMTPANQYLHTTPTHNLHTTPAHHTYTHLHTTPAHYTCSPHLHITPVHTYAPHLCTTPAHDTCTPHLHACSMNSILFWVTFLEFRKFALVREWVSSRTAADESWEEENPAFYIWWEDIMVPENPLAGVPWGTYDSSVRSGMMRLREQLQPWQQRLVTSVDSLQLYFTVWINLWP